MKMSERPISFCPYCGVPTDEIPKFGQLRPVCPSCGWIYFADPKVAAAVFVEENGRVLLVKRVHEPFQGKWSLPAGYVNAHEDPARAAARECLEETGLRVEVTGLVDVVGGREDPLGADIVIIYHASITGGELSAGDDAGQAAFFHRDDLPPIAFTSTRMMLK